MKITKKDILSLLNEMPMDFSGPDRPHPDYINKLASQDTPFKKVPFPRTGRDDQNFQERLGSEGFDDTIKRFKRYFGQDKIANPQNLGSISMEGYRALSQISAAESPHLDELSELAVNLVTNQFSIPDGTLNFDAKIVQDPNSMGDDEFTHDEEDEEQETPDLDFGNDIDDNSLEKSKRRLVNATIQGAAKAGQEMFHLVRAQLEEITGQPNIVDLYGKMMSSNDLSYWLFPDQDIKAASANGGKGGSEKVDRNTEPPTIFARGINFPTLLHELIKGLMEFFALMPNDGEYYEKVKSEDTITKEDWDLRLGVAIWKKIRTTIPLDLLSEEKLELQNYILNNIFNLPAKEYLILMREVMGGTPRGKQLIEKISRDMEKLYNDINGKTYRETNYEDETNDDDIYDDDVDTDDIDEPDDDEWWKDMLKQ